MPIDKDVEYAVTEVVAELGQPDKVAKRLVSWLKEMSERELSVQDHYQHLETLRNGIKLDEGEDA